MNLCEFEASPVYKVSSQTARTVTQRTLVWKNKQTKQQQQQQRLDKCWAVVVWGTASIPEKPWTVDCGGAYL